MSQGYQWGKNRPPIIKCHSIAKHEILRSYLVAYIQTLTSSYQLRELKLTLIDGFAGGGIYCHQVTGDPVQGSPIIMLEAVQEALFLVNQKRQNNPIHFTVHYFFIEKNKAAFSSLSQQIKEKGYASQIGETIFLYKGEFHEKYDDIIDFIKKKSPRGSRAIFLLDQYGFSQVPTQIIRSIFQSLKGAEVILNFAVDAFLNYAGDNELTKKRLNNIGLPDIFKDKHIDDIKANEKDWRLLIQSTLYKELVAACGATFYTPFFIRSSQGHGDYWLLHFSQRPRARDVMTRIHWEKNNYFIHYGGPGLDMFSSLGYVSDMYRQPKLDLGFCFDTNAKTASITSLCEQIPQIIYKVGSSGVTFSDLFSNTCNTSPASAQIYKETLGNLLKEKDIEIFSIDGTKRRSGTIIHDTDVIIPPTHFRLIF